MGNFTIEKAFKYIGLLLVWGSIAAVIYTVNMGVETSAQAKWPTTEAELLKAQFHQVVARLRDDPEAPGGKREVFKWIPEFEYRYAVNGQHYVGSQISTFDPTCETESDVLDLRRLISRNNTIVVYYNPANPAFAVLNPFPGLVNIWVGLTLSFITGFTGLAMFLVCRNA